ncbi:MAG: hypothetical protein P8103_13175 [Candidatus Thiodiazotropha sp.]
MRLFFFAVMAALLLTLVYRSYVSHQPLTAHTWYKGQDITEGTDPMPFDARNANPAGYPERDEGGDLPSDVYRAYIAAAAAGRFDESLLSDSSRALFETRRPSLEQLTNSVASYEACHDVEELADYNLAVMRYAPDQRHCPPITLRREAGHWRIDFSTMHHAVGLNQSNQWHFRSGRPPAEYAFAFSAWRFDDNGYPIIP